MCLFPVVWGANAAIIDFTGGTVYDSTGFALGVTNNTNVYVGAYYIEDGFKYSFLDAGGSLVDLGYVGTYYAMGVYPEYKDVIHAHWGGGIAKMEITKVGGGTFTLSYVEITSNTEVGGGQKTGNEDSYIWNGAGYSLKLPSSTWGFAYDFNGNLGDGVARLWMDSNFQDVTSVYFTTTNAYCFGMDNFYIDQAPPPVPVPPAMLLLGSGLAGLAAWRRFRP